jgi:DNA-binding transcriptional LysR family regulator
MDKPKRHSYKEVSLSQLRSFLTICEQGGYAAAARELPLTGPALWEQMQALERHFGMRLLERRGNGVRPTVQGERLIEMIRPLLAGLDSTKVTLQQQDGLLPAQVTLVTNLRVLSDEISEAMNSFHVRYPKIRLRVFYLDIHDVAPRVTNDEADVAFTLEPGPDRPPPAALVFESAGEVEYLLSARERHPLLRQRSLRLPQVVEHPLVLTEPGGYSRRRVEEVMHRHALADRLQVAVETSSDEYTLSCVRAGLGLGITVGISHGSLYRGLGVRALGRWFGTARVGFLWKRGARVPPMQRELAEAIRRRLAARRADVP